MGIFSAKKLDDATLVSGCVSNDRRCQEALYRKYFKTLFYMGLRYTSDEDLVQEITHDAFIKVFKSIDKYQFTGSFEGWLRKIMFHCVVDHFRSKKSPRFIELDDVRQILDESAVGHWDTEELLSHISALPDTHKTVFNMFALEGYSHQEIAKKINVSEGTSKWYLNQARTLLKEKINHQKDPNSKSIKTR
ncbi:MAG: sigma-70 family RNA polymerase sigma factor [Saprospiraceae bacterium]|nr:sigma-70 family RNA polymerase sigma factor [Saprospiraceae bacterium]MBK6814685.1 sigma-70 family RNA polymerase sigma factor [Saprospiraceae bacterium]MBK7370072.1 sigma-70 family RNA polymerase sigma factor [Saprospiraceae bacterium]MBK7438276.1 sigma-70 family RNA polymerase sigma factor [Saprospiraceae bacterium]MBK7606888.1 sigma-70 family RNA polymerase sigma factor [Saprospiraceae bacterium]